jgi:peptide/nickel transport system permease protein/dipeptide transport system permease protein
MPMFIAKRLISLVGIMIALTFIIFVLQQIIPADPARATVGMNAPRASVEAKRKELGLDQPLPLRYGRYLSRLLEGDLGVSTRTHRPVAVDLLHFLPASAELMLAAFAVGITLALAVAVPHAAGQTGSAIATGIIAASSAPIFLVGQVFALLLWFWLGWFPGGGRLGPDTPAPEGPTGLFVLDGLLEGHLSTSIDALYHLALPTLTLALPVAAALGRALTSSMTDVLRQTYIRTARAKGLGEFAVVRHHVLRNAAPVPLAMVGLQFQQMFMNILIVEGLFSWPGVGSYLVKAFAAADLPAILGVSLAFAGFYLVLAAVIDVLQAVLDPRIEAR